MYKMAWLWIKRTAVYYPFVLGLVLGLAISYGIRVLSSSSRCSQIITEGVSSSSNSNKNLIPDQIVNLAFRDSIKSEPQIQPATKSQNVDRVPNCIGKSNCGMMKENAGRHGKQQGLLFVGVMTANTYIGSRAKAVWETWAQEIPGKVVFFTGGNSYVNEAEGIDESSNDDEKRKSTVNDTIPLVPLLGVDDSYPPQKKSFMMLKYMHDNYLDDFEWFMRADDDMYLRSDKLADFLRSIDSRHLYFIGQAGKGNRVEKGTLNLALNENFCMGGPGIIMSKSTLAKVGPNVQECLQDMYSTHEDVEVGRCVQRFAGISCTWAYEMQSVFYHNSSGEDAFTGKLKKREVHRAITLHPIKRPQHLYRLHAYFQGLKIEALLYETVLIHEDIHSLSYLLNSSSNNKQRANGLHSSLEKEDSGQILSLPKKNSGLPLESDRLVVQKERNMVSWDFMSKGIYSPGTINPQQKMSGDMKEALEDVVRELMEMINGYSRARGRVIDFKEILYGYRRISPLHGADYILDLLLTYKKYRGKKMTVPVRRHVYIHRPFSPLQLRLVSNSTHVLINQHSKPSSMSGMSLQDAKPENVVFIVPVSGRFETFQRFLGSFTRSCLYFRERKFKDRRGGEDFIPRNITLTLDLNLQLVVVFFGSDLEKEKFLDLVNNVRESLLEGEGHVSCSIKVVQIDGAFSRGIALETGISQCSEGDLLFVIDVDMAFTANVIRRAQLNTIQGKQVYFPVVFSQYNPIFHHNTSENPHERESPRDTGSSNSKLKYNLSNNHGYWRDYGYGIAAFYKSDFRPTGGFDTSIKGWGKEDVALFDGFIRHTNLTIFRAPDPDLIHVFHETICDPTLARSQLEMCLGSRANNLGSTSNLMRHILLQKNRNKFQHLFS